MTRDELVEKMVRTFLEKSNLPAYSNHRIDLDAMSAVLGVCVEEMLGREVTKMEWSGNCERPADNAIDVVNRLLAARRARYSPPKRIRESVLLDIQVKVHEALQFPVQSPQQNAKLDEVERLIAELKLKEQP